MYTLFMPRASRIMFMITRYSFFVVLFYSSQGFAAAMPVDPTAKRKWLQETLFVAGVYSRDGGKTIRVQIEDAYGRGSMSLDDVQYPHLMYVRRHMYRQLLEAKKHKGLELTPQDIVDLESLRRSNWDRYEYFLSQLYGSETPDTVFRSFRS